MSELLWGHRIIEDKVKNSKINYTLGDDGAWVLVWDRWYMRWWCVLCVFPSPRALREEEGRKGGKHLTTCLFTTKLCSSIFGKSGSQPPKRVRKLQWNYPLRCFMSYLKCRSIKKSDNGWKQIWNASAAKEIG